jgi:hypothetical protein
MFFRRVKVKSYNFGKNDFVKASTKNRFKTMFCRDFDKVVFTKIVTFYFWHF